MGSPFGNNHLARISDEITNTSSRERWIFKEIKNRKKSDGKKEDNGCERYSLVVIKMGSGICKSGSWWFALSFGDRRRRFECDTVSIILINFVVGGIWRYEIILIESVYYGISCNARDVPFRKISFNRSCKELRNNQLKKNVYNDRGTDIDHHLS